ncbi:sugar kinase [Cyclobacterium marinum]|jgi:2-dehydro-3-deoxygluconokinase|uniref:PfkB domain protein n=1 Tax=Cyclobacterium marinum (strain ATCC 25205 / DSM 745 / LMG 13164 / NCIMB 1802) TaxID=880070 RepID=G0J7U7_CYCMS|nr:sugar kinase [Cyclobacterium marinum]AEL27795.1 PfkB domain protein [Cyclobacterium marinum DSM 745]MBI0397576.1 sugar kinase [Cyclobacterium marinum]MBR9777416.1 sugar kinase [Cytophagales bacterium]|tara:strand:+ start:53993 stop:55018 length:1026 start_codon:yes stop_codon:yes gene_type:complete
MSKKVVTLGEVMLRLSTPDFKRFVQTDTFDITYGGGEANVAGALCNYGLEGTFVTKVPDNPIGQSAINHLRRYGVDTQYIAKGGKRLGIYFLETGASMRASQVVYDRADAAISEAEISEFDFDKIFDGAVWFHTTGITPALSDKAAALTEAALKAAKAKGVTTSIDLNYRKKLWSKEKAKEVMTRLCQYVDVCIGNEEDAETTLGFHSKETDVTKGELNLEGYKDVFKQMKEKFGFKYIASTLRESYSASDNGWSALVYDGNEFYHSKKYDVRIVDRVGGGDSFASGLIYGLIQEMGLKDATEFAVAASALKHTFPGDMNHATLAEVKVLMGGDASGRVQR